MKSHKSRQVSSNQSPHNKTLTNQPPPPPSTPSQPPPSNPSKMSSPSTPDVGSDSVSRGSSRRRSSRLAAKSGNEVEEAEKQVEEENKGKDLIDSDNLVSESGERSEVRVDSSRKKKARVLMEGSSGSNSVRRSSRIASKSGGEDLGSGSIEMGVRSVVKRKNVDLDSKSEKVRVLDFGDEEGSGVGEEEKGKDSDSDYGMVPKELGTEKDSGGCSGGVKEGKEVIAPDSPSNSNQLVGNIGSGILRRRSQRLAVNSLQGVEESNGGRGVSVPSGKEGDGYDKGSIGRSDAEIGDDDQKLFERMPVPGGHNLATGGTKRRSPRLAVYAVRGLRLGSGNSSSKGKVNVDNATGEHDNPEISDADIAKDYSSFTVGGQRYVQNENGAFNLDQNSIPDSQEKRRLILDLNLKPEEQEEDIRAMTADDSSLVLSAASALMQLPQSIESERAKQAVRWKARSHAIRRGRFQDVARERASHFAHFRDEEDETNATAPTSESVAASEEIEDWPGPFSTAMKIIKDRNKQLNVPRMEDATQGASSTAPVIHWIPSDNSVENRVKFLVPSLQDLCLNLLSKNADAIASLKYVPSELKNRLTQMLCDSRKMDSRFMDLLVADSPEIVHVKDCSWLTEEQITKTFDEWDTTKLSVLHLDLCGRCMTDYVIRDTFARSPNCLPALVAISLKGACRLTDTGLSSLVASSPSLRSINLCQSSLITSVGIDTIASRLGLLLKELYLDDCQGIDAMLMLPSLKKLRCLEVLSVADIPTVCDDFVCHFVTEQGSNMKELGLANCDKLTDRSVKAIAENCSALCALDLSNLRKLTDISIAHLANGCSSIQNLKLRYNPSSDEAIAAFLETSGQSLKELSLNGVKKVGPNTAISLAKNCTRNLQYLDLSWCRNLMDEALGYIVDSCLSLRVLKLFGCTQITNVFVDGHSNHQLQIIGLKMTPILEHLAVHDPQDGPMRYSYIPSFPI